MSKKFIKIFFYSRLVLLAAGVLLLSACTDTKPAVPASSSENQGQQLEVEAGAGDICLPNEIESCEGE